jgi:hypothetical protein
LTRVKSPAVQAGFVASSCAEKAGLIERTAFVIVTAAASALLTVKVTALAGAPGIKLLGAVTATVTFVVVPVDAFAVPEPVEVQ